MADAREDVLHDKLMRFHLHTGHGIFHEDLSIPALVGVPCGGFDADVGGDAAKDYGPHLSATQLQVEFGAVESAPLTFGDDEIPRLWANLGRQFRPVGRQRAGVELHGSVGGRI